ncbi:DUF4439 domain-containing protein [Pseudarthrobacter sp. J75]|uniref:DUF4439 domain-containing protein n=1 Tax=unclassified Pseudarthrobacter TaxID=2647000 RepID=UPI002E819BCB|nr:MULTISPECIES: DUF4439 domain-containing protein [unclassified Pseudarthrobacter]MEE2521798.1 DUF4439 domain-containing protein [Pseudarthrobacter sp. J47]MEE2527875.1 DUF4439 domain-containing protein [Pseudarthrobacter sp. J75]
MATSAVILSSGMVLTLREPAPPAPPTFSEQALADASSDAAALRLTARNLEQNAPADAAETALLEGTVTLLTVQERALFRQLPSAVSTATATSAAASGSASAPASGSASASGAPTMPAPATTADLLAGLVASAAERLTDAQEADGGTSRLLAAVGTGQLLEATSLAAAAGVSLPEGALTVPPLPTADAQAPHTSAPGPTASATPTATTTPAESSATCQVPASSGFTSALTAALEVERQSDYAYQVALPRLTGGAAAQASTAWARHRELAADAESMLARYCLEPPAPAPGYALAADFFTNPAAGLGVLEAGALPAYGDLVAFTDGAAREWTVQALLDTALRAQRWGTDPGPLPGLALETSALPALPTDPASGSPAPVQPTP